jgi:hypothetical protein
MVGQEGRDDGISDHSSAPFNQFEMKESEMEIHLEAEVWRMFLDVLFKSLCFRPS